MRTQMTVFTLFTFVSISNAHADLSYEELSTMKMGDGMQKATQQGMTNAAAAGSMAGDPAKMAAMSTKMMNSFEMKLKVWLVAGKKKSQQQMSEKMKDNMSDSMAQAYGPAMAAMIAAQQKKNGGQAAAPQQAMRDQVGKPGPITLVDLSGEKVVDMDPDRHTFKERTFAEIREKRVQDAQFKEAMGRFMGELEKNSNGQKPSATVVETKSAGEKSVAGVRCEIHHLEVQYKVEKFKRPISMMKLEICTAPSLADAAKEFYAFENTAAKAVGRLSDKNNGVDLLYNADDTWAKDAVRRMQALKGFPMERKVIFQFAAIDMEDMLEDAMKNPDVKARVDAQRADIMAKREAALNDPAKQAAMCKPALDSGQATQEDCDEFFRDPTFYDRFMAKMMAQTVQKQKDATKGMNMTFSQQISSISTKPIAADEFAVPTGYAKN